jgi:glycosyltransferase involved in cell wall biosynthesis
VLAIMEAGSVTGPAKNLIGFGRWTRTPEGAASGIELSVATYARRGTGAGRAFLAAAESAGLSTWEIPERGRFDYHAAAELARIVDQVDPHIVQTHNTKSHLFVKLSKFRARRPWVAFQHGYQSTDLKLHLYNQVDRFTFPAADVVVSVCKAFTPRLLGYGVLPQKLRVLHNSAEPKPRLAPERLRALRAQLGVADADSVILTIGRMSREKGHADLIEALHAMPPTRQPWKLVLVGEGPERQRLESLVARRGMGDRVAFAGYRTDIDELYGIASLFALPSHSEGSSNVILEAMAASLPIVATAVGGTPEILRDEVTALLPARGDPRALAQAMTRLLNDEKLAAGLSSAALDDLRSRFSPGAYRGRLLEIYRSALAARPA